MNERIKSLLNVCGMPNEDLMDIYGDKNKSFYMQQFAELIIKECALVCSRTEDDFLSDDDTYNHAVGAGVAGGNIMNHFGIE